ncbi:MAG: hypothetical protein ACRETX_10485, partial [Steroidobacteraceae bacterium]
MPFTIALSFMMGILATIAAYSLRDDASAVREVVQPLSPAMPAIAPAGEHIEPEAAPALPTASIGPVTEAAIVVQLRDRDLKI